MVISPISYYFPEYLADIDTKMPMKETTRPPLKFQVHLYRRVMGLFCVLSFIPISCICPKHPPLKCTMLSLLERNRASTISQNLLLLSQFLQAYFTVFLVQKFSSSAVQKYIFFRFKFTRKLADMRLYCASLSTILENFKTILCNLAFLSRDFMYRDTECTTCSNVVQEWSKSTYSNQ